MTTRLFRVSRRSRHRVLYVAPLLMAACLTGGCTNLEGVNVGANIPIGGPVTVGMNKTIGSSAPKQTSQTQPQQTPVISENPDDEKESTSPAQ
jgi:hypothetical protein